MDQLRVQHRQLVLIQSDFRRLRDLIQWVCAVDARCHRAALYQRGEPFLVAGAFGAGYLIYDAARTAGADVTALHDKEGNTIGVLKVTRDLTEKKAAEDRHSNYAEELRIKNEAVECIS